MKLSRKSWSVTWIWYYGFLIILALDSKVKTLLTFPKGYTIDGRFSPAGRCGIRGAGVVPAPEPGAGSRLVRCLEAGLATTWRECVFYCTTTSCNRHRDRYAEKRYQELHATTNMPGRLVVVFGPGRARLPPWG